MKKRKTYVSNSSSCSFIVTTDLTDKGITCLKLTNEQKKLINQYPTSDDKFTITDFSKDYYITQFINDCKDEKYDLLDSVEHHYYAEGQLCEEPYTDEFFNEYNSDFGKSVYIKKEHDEAEEMTFKKMVQMFKKMDYTGNVLVKYTKTGVEITFKE